MITDVVRVALNTSTGTQDITGDLGGLSAKAAIFLTVGATSDGAAADNAVIGVGFTDGTNHYCSSATARHNVSTAEAQRVVRDDSCIILNNVAASSIDFAAEFSAWITDGVRINITDAGSAYFVVVLLIAGTDVSAKVGLEEVTTQDALTHVTDVGFESSVVFCSTPGHGSGSRAVIGSGKFSLGAATSTSQASLGWFSDNGSSGSRCTTYCANSRACMELDAGFQWGIEVTGIDSAGFNLFPRDGNANSEIGYLALKFDNSSVDVSVVDTPTATGNDTQTIGIQPSFVMMLASSCDAVNTIEAGSDAGNIGISLFNSSNEYMQFIADDDGAATTDTESLSDDAAVNFSDQQGSAMIAATFVSFPSNGYTLNYSDADSTVRKWVSIAFQEGQAQTASPLTDTLSIDGRLPVALKGPSATTPSSETLVITKAAPSVISIHEAKPNSGSVAVTGKTPSLGSGEEINTKPKSAILSIISYVPSASIDGWVPKADSITQWTALTDQCRST